MPSLSAMRRFPVPVLVLVLALSACSSVVDADRALVERYLQAHVDGRLGEAWGLTALARQSDVVPVPDAAAAAAAGRIDRFSVDEVDDEVGTATATVWAGAESRQVEFGVETDSGTIRDVDLWHPMALQSSPRSARLTVNTIPVAEHDPGTPGLVVMAPPGVWNASADAGELVDVSPGEWVLGLHDSVTAPAASGTIQARLSEAGVAQADAQLDVLLADCLADRSGQRADCPNQLPDATVADPGSVRWTMTQEPRTSWEEFILDQAVADTGEVEWSAIWTADGAQRSASRFTWAVGAAVATYGTDGTVTVSILH